MHYITSTNCGLVQGNMSWTIRSRGEAYHWVTDLYDRLKLPVFPAVVEALVKQVQDHINITARQQSDEGKKKRVQQKIARAEDQAERKKWGKRQAVQHSYGADDNDDGAGEIEDPGLMADAQSLMSAIGDANEVTIISGNKCRCGSTQHKRTSHSLCPLNPKNNSTN